MLNDDIADRGGHDGDGKILDRKDVVQCEQNAFAWPVGAIELTHQQVGVEQEDDERDLDDRSPERGEGLSGLGVFGHEAIVQNSAEKAN